MPRLNDGEQGFSFNRLILTNNYFAFLEWNIYDVRIQWNIDGVKAPDYDYENKIFINDVNGK